MDNIKVGNNQYPAIVTGRLEDRRFNKLPSKTIRVQMSYENASRLFVDEVSWSILGENDEYDNSDYNKAGPITDYRDGWIEVIMIKQPEEQAVDNEILNILFGEEP